MKPFQCDCGHSVYFDSHQCIACGSVLGFDPECLEMKSLTPGAPGTLIDSSGRQFRLCANGTEHGVCNWLQRAEDENPLCFGCQFNRTIPELAKHANIRRWGKFESGKKRLLYTLLRLGLPVENGHRAPRTGLLFDFVEDSRSDSSRFPETFVPTGYLGGVITINALEADDPAREAMREQMGESYRTLLGHLRHESGHYYWSILDPDPQELARFASLFGDYTEDYQAALDRYYRDGPQADWPARHISAYASSHPNEDWAESWGHYLYIYDALETAAAHGLADVTPEFADFATSISVWREFSIALNELNRSIGTADAYPFVVTAAVEEKLHYVHQVIHRLRTPPSATEAH